MSTISRIESHDLCLGDVYKDFYLVPDFQREYVWETEHVEKLLADVVDALYDYDNRPVADAEYFIGSVVVCRDHSGCFRLIDGQQRVTTIYVTLCAMRDALVAAGVPPSDTLKSHIQAAQMDPITGEDAAQYRVMLQYEDSKGVLERIAEGGNNIDDIHESTASVTNLLNAYRIGRQFISATFEDDPARIKAFHAALTARVKLIRIKTPDLADALKVFETINDRGVGLDAMDLLKNLLFISTPPEEYPKLKERWKGITDTLHSRREKALRFLRYYIMAHHDIDSRRGIREDKVYSWFSKNTIQCGIDSRPLEFVDGLVECAQVWANFVDGKDPQGKPNVYLQNISALSGVARQHFVLLLAGRHLPSELFSTLARYIEDLFFCYVISREATKTFERNFARWAADLRAVSDEEGLDAFLAQHFKPEMQRLSPAFGFAFRELNVDRIQKYRMRYILAKLTQHVETQAWGNPTHQRLDQYLDSSVHIEHILPQNPRQDVYEAFDRREEYEDWMARFGNLTLLEKPINESVSNGSFEQKVPGYRESRFLLTQSIASKPQVGKDTKVNRAVENLIQFDHWDSKTIERRQCPSLTMTRRGNDASQEAHKETR